MNDSSGDGTSPTVASGAGKAFLADDLELIDKLGEGGMGAVYKARHRTMGRIVAVKVLTVDDPQLRQRFEREGRIVQKMQHPNIVGALEIRPHAEPPMIVFEFVDGENLREFLDREGALRPSRALKIVKEMLAGLAYAHESGVIHRDLKCENVMMTREGSPKIADFGVAASRDIASHLTRTGLIIGTPAYMAPEQTESLRVTARADVYAVGVMLFQMLSGRLPFFHQSPIELVLMHRKDTPPDLTTLVPEVGHPLAAVVKRCLAKDPDKRYENARELLTELDHPDMLQQASSTILKRAGGSRASASGTGVASTSGVTRRGATSGVTRVQRPSTKSPLTKPPPPAPPGAGRWVMAVTGILALTLILGAGWKLTHRKGVQEASSASPHANQSAPPAPATPAVAPSLRSSVPSPTAASHGMTEDEVRTRVAGLDKLYTLIFHPGGKLPSVPTSGAVTPSRIPRWRIMLVNLLAGTPGARDHLPHLERALNEKQRLKSSLSEVLRTIKGHLETQWAPQIRAAVEVLGASSSVTSVAQIRVAHEVLTVFRIWDALMHRMGETKCLLNIASKLPADFATGARAFNIDRPGNCQYEGTFTHMSGRNTRRNTSGVVLLSLPGLGGGDMESLNVVKDTLMSTFGKERNADLLPGQRRFGGFTDAPMTDVAETDATFVTSQERERRETKKAIARKEKARREGNDLKDDDKRSKKRKHCNVTVHDHSQVQIRMDPTGSEYSFVNFTDLCWVRVRTPSADGWMFLCEYEVFVPRPRENDESKSRFAFNVPKRLIDENSPVNVSLTREHLPLWGDPPNFAIKVTSVEIELW